MRITVTVNGTDYTRVVEPRLLLIHFLRDALGHYARFRHHDTDLGQGFARGGPVDGHGVADDGTVVGGEQDVGATRRAGLTAGAADQGRGRADRREEPLDAGPGGKPGQEAGERGQVCGVWRPDPDGHAGRNLVYLGSIHRLSMDSSC